MSLEPPTALTRSRPGAGRWPGRAGGAWREAGAVIPLLLEACPSFGTRWAAYAAAPTFDASLLYIHLGEFACHLVELMRSGSTAEFPAVFEAVERLHTDGDSYVREAATVGLLEGLQNHASSAGLDPVVFEPHLGRDSAKWWAELNGFWDGRRPYVGAGLKGGS